MNCPRLPNIPSGRVSQIDPSWFRALNDCLQYAMTSPRGDGFTIINEAGGTLRARLNSDSHTAALSEPCIRVPIRNMSGADIYKGSPVALSGFPSSSGGTASGEEDPFYAYVQPLNNWNVEQAKCLAVCDEDVPFEKTGTATISGVAYTRVYAQLNRLGDEGKKVCPSGSVFALAADDYKGPSAKIIRVCEFDAEREVQYVQVLLGNGSNAGNGSSFPGYTGPWGLFFAGSQIDVNPGLIWTPDGTSYRQPNGISKPGETSYVVISSSGVLSAISIEGGLYDLTRQSYWSDHALLGLYDAENDSLTQYHFSPIVFIIQTEEFIIAP